MPNWGCRMGKFVTWFQQSPPFAALFFIHSHLQPPPSPSSPDAPPLTLPLPPFSCFPSGVSCSSGLCFHTKQTLSDENRSEVSARQNIAECARHARGWQAGVYLHVIQCVRLSGRNHDAALWILSAKWKNENIYPETVLGSSRVLF